MNARSTFFNYWFRWILYASIVVSFSSCSDDPPQKEDIRTALLQQINDLRKKGCNCGSDQMPPVKPLVWNNVLEDAAASHATDMYTHNYFSHESQDGTPPIVRVQQMGYDGDYVGEVIARKYYSTTEVMEGWKESESHCRALMDSVYNEMGGARKEDYWVVDLGRSK